MTYFLFSKRIGFRKWSKKDILLAERLWGNSDVTKFIALNGQFSREQIYERLNKEIEHNNSFGIQYWPIFLLDTDDFIGCCGLRPYDVEKNILEIGAHLLPDYWKKGLATEAMSTVIKYAFTQLNVLQLFAGHNPENIFSKGLLTKLGFKFTHYEFYLPTGLKHPSYLLSAEKYLEQN